MQKISRLLSYCQFHFSSWWEQIFSFETICWNWTMERSPPWEEHLQVTEQFPWQISLKLGQYLKAFARNWSYLMEKIPFDALLRHKNLVKDLVWLCGWKQRTAAIGWWNNFKEVATISFSPMKFLNPIACRHCQLHVPPTWLLMGTPCAQSMITGHWIIIDAFLIGMVKCSLKKVMHAFHKSVKRAAVLILSTCLKKK